ncbi:PucR family transcriptional regulator [Streptomyces beijiangensis]|uniref:Helix-turn-helix domain-containing protein n=1 Tax=Streptomyces beijiangensis TaxID=163361 RepID=A0A939F6N6_9ACTN|nr:helix-turn-helix domain-containing protein [Streptomyces beijiangensis]MBO0513052.1 helix-turn-helix domain-containing protein [Streptomyces beijiangensis]
MTDRHDPGPSDWVFQLTHDLAYTPRASASSERTIADATDRIGPGPVDWAVAVGEELALVIIREVPELGGGQAPFETLRMGTEAATLRALLLLADPAADRAIPEESLLGDREFARRRLGLDKVLRGIRVAHAALTQALMAACQERAAPSERSEQFRRISELLFDFIDEFSSRMTAEYLAEHDRWLTSGAAAREETVRAILDGQPVREEAARDLLAYRVEGRHLAVIAWCDSPTAETPGDLQRAAAELLQLRGCSSVLVLPTGRTTVWAWGDLHAPIPAAAPGAYLYPEGCRFAFGSVRHGLTGFRQSHEDARHAARIVELNPHGTGRVVDYPDVELPALLSADLPALRRFVGDELGALAADSPHTEQLRRTLRLYLRNERSLMAAAAQLHVARNTVTYRVKRAQELLGHDLATQLPEVMAALEATRVLGAAVLRPEANGSHDDPPRHL